MLLDRQVFAIIICNQSLLFGVRLRLLYVCNIAAHAHLHRSSGLTNVLSNHICYIAGEEAP